ncbi:MAG: hypothetical protein AABY22_35825 [Nanoarchaeota archaeon]
MGKKIEKRINKIFFLILTSILVTVLILFIYTNFMFPLYLFLFDNIFHPAYFSMKADCDGIEAVEGSGYVLSGYYDTETKNITIITDNCANIEELERTIKHELIHQKQDAEGRLYDCNISRFGVFLNEVEANIAEFLP